MSKERPIWPEAEIIADPVKVPGEPLVLVRRRHSGLVSADADIAFFEGPPAISLFTGCGGLDLGLESAGWTTVLQHEWAEAPCQTLIGNRPRCFRHAALIQGDIRKTSTEMILKEAGLMVGEAFIVGGGPPCQGFSTANPKSHKGTYDKRNDLVFEFLRVVDEAKPRFFMFENVAGFVRFNEQKYVEMFLKTAHECFYEMVYGLVDCSEYGVPQRRVRFICMGTRRDFAEIKGCIAGLPEPQCFGPKDLDRLKKIERLPEFSAEYRSICRTPGVRYFPDRPFICNPAPNGEGGRAINFRKFFDDLEKNEPDRLVTVKEAA